jgi:hypothetical protein
MSKLPTDEMIKKQADRLLTLPANPGDSTEVARAIKRHCKTEYHVKSVVQYLLDEQQFYPTPSAIRSAADMLPSVQPPKYKPAEEDCALCDGTGFVYVLKDGYDCADTCECRKTRSVAR